MVRQSGAPTKADMVKQAALEQENKILRDKIAAMENKPEPINAVTDTLSNEMKKIRQKGKVSANTITVKEAHDHMNISLWTKYGKRIGPMHPTGAVETLNRFADLGVLLTSDQPTPSQIAEYKETAEYKRFEKLEASKRAKKDKSRRSGVMEKLTAEIAKMSGTNAALLNNILSAAEVGKIQ